MAAAEGVAGLAVTGSLVETAFDKIAREREMVEDARRAL
jgi:hypothetical protein